MRFKCLTLRILLKGTISLERQSDGKFKDDDLSRILQDATQHSAGAFKARGIPDSLRVVEIMGIEQARTWGACTLNEFRKVRDM